MIQNNLVISILPKQQQILFNELSDRHFIKDYYLVGGTALALQIGHRISIDFDFFCKNDIDLDFLKSEIKVFGKIEIFQEKKNTLHCRINNIRVSFISYKYKILDDCIVHNKIFIAGLNDIACMKLSAVSSRGSKKDFIDLFYLLRHTSFKKIFKNFKKKYGDMAVNEYQIMKSLLYFEDAENEPMPIMKEKIEWKEIKKKIQTEVKKIVN